MKKRRYLFLCCSDKCYDGTVMNQTVLALSIYIITGVDISRCLNPINLGLSNVQCAMCNVQCAMCNVQYAMCNAHCSLPK